MNRLFPLHQSHLDLAHQLWKTLASPGDFVIDATCGNGQDTLKLANIVLTELEGFLWAFDILPESIDTTRKRLESHLPLKLAERIVFKNSCHSQLTPLPCALPLKLVVYNLGYRPGGDKTQTTRSETTLQSVITAETLLSAGGAITITCYSGHPAGAKEEEALLKHASELDPKLWNCCHHRWINRKCAPSLLLLQKNLYDCNVPSH